MVEVEDLEQLRLALERHSIDKCIEVALRAAFRNFTPPNLSGNIDASEKNVFPYGRLLLQAVVHSRFHCIESKNALNQTIAHLIARERFIGQSSAYLAAIATLNRDSTSAIETIESVAVSFASEADQEQFLFGQTPRDFSTRHAYDAAFALLLNTSLADSRIPKGDAFDRPLWNDTVDFKVPLDQRINYSEYFHGQRFAFWREWHHGFLVGKPLDWQLQRRIALISEDIWSSGLDAVALEIEQIRARWDVETALKGLDDDPYSRTSARHGIGGNNPPESIQDELLVGSISLIWEAEKELSTALEDENPTREWIEAILAKFKSGLASFIRWCAGKGDLAVDTLIKWGIPATGAGYAAKYPEKIEGLIEAIERWLPYLS